jgi:phenylacetate-CoA ligase
MSRWLAWNVVFRLHERLKGHDTFAILREMRGADRLTLPELEQLQRTRLQEFIRYGYAHVPYVKQRMLEAGIAPADIGGPADLVNLPLLTKALIRKHRGELRSDAAGPLSSFTTGGSTGEPLIFDLSKRRTASRVACRQRVAEWWGVSIGDPELAIWGSPVEVTRQDWIRGVRDRLLATRLLSAFEMSQETMSRYLHILERTRPVQLFGYPSSIHALCMLARKQGRNLRTLGLKVTFVTGELLYPHQREAISETLNCPVANWYGGRDSGFIAHECPQGGLHLMADAIVTEVVDASGKRVSAGESGEIVVTDLFSHEAPFLRYATGDRGVLSERRCSCGRASPLLERVEGRSNDCIVTPDGRIINSLGLVYALREIEGIEHFRIHQRKVDDFHVQIVRNERFPADGEARVRQGWTKLLRWPVQVTFDYVADLPQAASGKFRHIISDVLPQGPAGNPAETLFSPPPAGEEAHAGRPR